MIGEYRMESESMRRNMNVYRNMDNEFYVLSNGIDENNQGGIHPVIVSFDALETTDNPGIRIQ